MKRQLKYQFFLGRKANFCWVILFLLVIFTFVVYLMNHLQYSGIINLSELEKGANMYLKTTFLGIVLNFYYSDKIILFVGAFVVLFTLMENQSGFIKAIYSSFVSPKKVVMAKLAVILTFIVASFFIVFCITGLCSLTFLKHNGFGDFTHFLILSLVQILIEFSFSAIIMFFCLLIKSTLPSLLSTLFYIMFAPVTVYRLIDLIFRNVFKIENFAIARLLPYGNTYILEQSDSRQHFIIAIVSSIFFLVVPNYLSVKLLSDRDVL